MGLMPSQHRLGSSVAAGSSSQTGSNPSWAQSKDSQSSVERASAKRCSSFTMRTLSFRQLPGRAPSFSMPLTSIAYGEPAAGVTSETPGMPATAPENVAPAAPAAGTAPAAGSAPLATTASIAAEDADAGVTGRTTTGATPAPPQQAAPAQPNPTGPLHIAAGSAAPPGPGAATSEQLSGSGRLSGTPHNVLAPYMHFTSLRSSTSSRSTGDSSNRSHLMRNQVSSGLSSSISQGVDATARASLPVATRAGETRMSKLSAGEKEGSGSVTIFGSIPTAVAARNVTPSEEQVLLEMMPGQGWSNVIRSSTSSHLASVTAAAGRGAPTAGWEPHLSGPAAPVASNASLPEAASEGKAAERAVQQQAQGQQQATEAAAEGATEGAGQGRRGDGPIRRIMRRMSDRNLAGLFKFKPSAGVPLV